jgi:hypothetical protein
VCREWREEMYSRADHVGILVSHGLERVSVERREAEQERFVVADLAARARPVGAAKQHVSDPIRLA